MSVMNGENENGKHDLNFFLDKQLQQKLLEADETFLEREYLTNHITSSLIAKSNGQHSNNAANSSVKQQTQTQTNNNNNQGNEIVRNAQKFIRYLHSAHICGWCPNPAIHYRKSETDVAPRSRGGLGVPREVLFSRDSKSRPQNLNNFVFRHYVDPRKYIEQYRREHACYDTTNSSATKSEFLDSRRFYAYNQYSPLAVGSQGAPSNNYVPQPQSDLLGSESQQKSQSQTPVLQYSNRREQQRQIISANMRSKNKHQYKLSKTKSENSYTQDYTEEYIETLEINSNKQRKPGSAKERSSPNITGAGRPVQKIAAATKVNIPAGTSSVRNIHQTPPGSISEGSSVAQFHSHKLGQVGSASRTLDSLSCVVNTPLDKQPQVLIASGKESSSNKEKTEMVLSARQKNSKNSSNNIPPTTPTQLTASAAGQSSKDIRTNSRTIQPSQNGSSSHDNGEKMVYDNSAVHHVPNGANEEIDLSSDSSAVSIGCLSTKCLGVEATVKPQPKLEASCTYHVFPNEFTLNHHAGYTQPLLWNPSKSALEKRLQPLDPAPVEFGLPSPFRHSPRARPRTEGSRVVEFITKEFVADPRPINLCSADISFPKETPRICSTSTPGLKTNTIKPDLPATFALQGFSKRPHFEAFGKKRSGMSKTAMTRKKKEARGEREVVGRKSKSASTDASNHSTPGSSALKLKPVTSDSPSPSNSNNAVSTALAPVPYFKFWNSSLPPRSRDRRRAGADKTCELTMQQLAEMVLADESGQRDQELKEAAKKVLEQHSKPDGGQQSSAGIATGDPWFTPSIDRITQDQLLGSLCCVDQQPSQPVPYTLHLTLNPEDTSGKPEGSTDQYQGTSAQRTPGAVKANHDRCSKKNSCDTTNPGIPAKNLFRKNKNRRAGKDVSLSANEQKDQEVPHSMWRVREEDLALHGKREHSKRQARKELSVDITTGAYHNQADSSQQKADALDARIKSKSQEWHSQWQTRSLMIHKSADDNSVPHRKKIKHLIEQSRMKNKMGRNLDVSSSTTVVPDVSLGLNPFDPDTAHLGLFTDGVHSQNPFLKITHCSTFVSDGVVSRPARPLPSEPDTEHSHPSKQSFDSDNKACRSNNNNNNNKANSGERIPAKQPSPSLSSVEELINNLQTSGPTIPPLYGTSLANQITDKSTGKNAASEKEKLCPLSHPDLEKLARHLSVKVRISHMKYSTKDGQVTRSQTIHL